MRSSIPNVVPLVALALLVACQDGAVTGPPSSATRPAPTPNIVATDAGPVSYFAPRTVTREGTGVQVVPFTLNDHDHSLFMDPFVLSVRADGDQRIVGIVRVDGVPVLERRDLVAMGSASAPVTREVPIGPSSVVTIELQGPSGGSLTFWIDAPLQPPPVITITSPVRHNNAAVGQPDGFLQQGTLSSSAVDITGTACHVRYPITQLEIAGVAVPVPGTNLCEAFTVTQQSRWGLSIITGTAQNSRGRIGTVVQSYVRSADYYPSPNGAVSIPGFFTRLTQPLIDDGDRTTANDIATVLQNHLNTLDTTIPAVTLVACQEILQVNATGGRIFQSVRVNSISTSSAGLAVDVSLLNPSIDVLVRTELNFFDGNCTGGMSNDGRISASEVRLSGTVKFNSATGAVAMSFNNLGLQWLGFSNDLSGLPGNVVSLTVTTAQTFLGDVILQLMTPAISDLLASFFDNFTETPGPIDIPLNSALLRVGGGLYRIETGGVSPNGFVQFGMTGQVEGLTIDPTVRATQGAIRALCVTEVPCQGLAPVPPFSNTSGVGLSVHQDMLNSAFWMAWRAGAFNVPDVSTLPLIGPLNALSMSAQATLPPISMASGADPSMFEMAWGDVRVRSTFDPAAIGAPAGPPIEVEAWVSGAVRGNLVVNALTSRLSLTDVTGDVHVELITATLGIPDAALRAAIQADVRAAITSMSRSAIAILPLDLTVDGLGTVNVTSVSRNNFHYFLTGSIQ
jgi:hypothetical protein